MRSARAAKDDRRAFDERDADAVNRLLAVVPSLTAAPGEDATRVEPPAARTPYQVQRAFVAAAEAALKAIEEAEANVDAWLEVVGRELAAQRK